MRCTGLYTALITPFKDNRVDEEGLRQLIHFQRESGVDGLTLLGTTAETPTLMPQEREQILSIAQQEAQDLPLMALCGTNNTHQTLKNIEQAESFGIDSLLIVAPYYNKPTQEGLFQYFELMANATSLPIIVYNIPGRTGVNISVETLMRLSSIPNIIGIKEASGSITQIQAMIAQTDDRFSVLSGDDTLTYPLMALGAQGVISVISNVAPGPMKQMIDASMQGDLPQARTLHYQLLPLFNALSLETNPIPIKAAMHLCGLPSGTPRLPLTPMAEVHLAQLKTTLIEYGLL